jgi:hypothetical protein
VLKGIDRLTLEGSCPMTIHSGHIRKRKVKNGYNYQVNVELLPDPFTGIRKRICKTLPTKKDAEAVLAQMLNELNKKTYIADNETVLQTFIDEWLDIYIRPHTSPSTYESYRVQINNHIYPSLGKIRLQSIKSSDIQKVYNSLQKASSVTGKGLAPKTIKNIHMNLRACLDRAVKDDIIRKNPANDVLLPKAKETEH